MKLLKLCLFCILLISGCSATPTNNAEEMKDTSAPWINVKNYVFETTVGNPINYETAYAYDDIDFACNVEVSGYVNFNKVGEYYLKYVARDTSGNKSEEPFTIIVKPEGEQATSTPNTNISIDSTCDTKGAIDPNQPCDIVVSNLDEYTMLFQDSDGYNRCVAIGDEEIEKETINDYKCETIYTNDNNIWGYGIKTN
ncbi:immunoglobulin-like domain-containing protein [Anaerorhabdus sp.]|uniref:immunoglobulin-like domain-containing protein n=1 Tax=Anaerorhabdus sp. TaxID=1872524 RepID=UPI002FCC714C